MSKFDILTKYISVKNAGAIMITVGNSCNV